MKIRSDLIGIVPVRSGATVIILRAGDEVPEGVRVGKHVLDATPTPRKLAPPPKAGPGSGAPKWRAYAADNNISVGNDAPRDEVIATLESAGIRTE